MKNNNFSEIFEVSYNMGLLGILDYFNIISNGKLWEANKRDGYWIIFIWKKPRQEATGSIKAVSNFNKDFEEIREKIRDVAIIEEIDFFCYKHLDGAEKFIENNIFIFIVE